MKAKAKLNFKSSSKPKKKYAHHHDHYNTSETYLTASLSEDLQDAWMKIREYISELGEQRIYTSGRAIMFSKKVCFVFVRPKKTFLEVVIFLTDSKLRAQFKSVKPVSKTKSAHTFRLVHGDQVEGALTDALQQAYSEAPSLSS